MSKPEIRFNGFDGEWEEKNYKEVFDTSVSNNTFSRAELTSEKTSIKNVHYGDILSKLPPAEPVALIRHKWPATSCGKPLRNASHRDF